MSDVSVDVVFASSAAAAAVATIHAAVRDTETVLRGRKADLDVLHQGWEGYARDRFDEWCLAFDVVAAGILDALRQTAAQVATQQMEAQELQAFRVRRRAEIAEQQERAEAARRAAEQADRLQD
jgi:uncharacterized protein YukE